MTHRQLAIAKAKAEWEHFHHTGRKSSAIVLNTGDCGTWYWTVTVIVASETWYVDLNASGNLITAAKGI